MARRVSTRERLVTITVWFAGPGNGSEDVDVMARDERHAIRKLRQRKAFKGELNLMGETEESAARDA